MTNGLIEKSLPNYDGCSAYEGALRFFNDSDQSTIDNIYQAYGNLAPDLRIFASDAFGTLYGLNIHERVSIFWTETAQVENLEITKAEFFGLIINDPEGTLNYSLYRDAVRKMGRPSFQQNFAFKIEIALGGQLSIDNIYICAREIHFQALASIARQIASHEIGTQYSIKG